MAVCGHRSTSSPTPSSNTLQDPVDPRDNPRHRRLASEDARLDGHGRDHLIRERRLAGEMDLCHGAGLRRATLRRAGRLTRADVVEGLGLFRL